MSGRALDELVLYGQPVCGKTILGMYLIYLLVNICKYLLTNNMNSDHDGCLDVCNMFGAFGNGRRCMKKVKLLFLARFAQRFTFSTWYSTGWANDTKTEHLTWDSKWLRRKSAYNFCACDCVTFWFDFCVDDKRCTLNASHILFVVDLSANKISARSGNGRAGENARFRWFRLN